MPVSGAGHPQEPLLGVCHALGSTKRKFCEPHRKWVLQKSKVVVFPEFWVLLSDLPYLIKTVHVWSNFLTFRPWQCLFKSTKRRPYSIHCARSPWSFSAVPLQPFKLLGESKVHIPAAGGSPLMSCLWLELLCRGERPNLFKCLLPSLALEAGEWGPCVSSFRSVECIGKSVFCSSLNKPK